MLKRYLLFVLFFSIFSISVEAFAEAYPDLSAEAYILVEMETGQVLAEKMQINVVRRPAQQK